MNKILKSAAVLAGTSVLSYMARASLIEGRSIRSRLAEDIIRIVNFDLEEVDAEMLARNFKENRKEHQIPKGIMGSEIEHFEVAGMKVYKMRAGRPGGRRVLYLHGGGYIHQPSIFHWLFLDRMVQDTGLEFIVPIYPKTPEHSFEAAYTSIKTLYDQLLLESPERLVLMGDSAGGGMAIGFTQWLSEEGAPSPEGIIVISPWLDVTLGHPEINKYAKLDPILKAENLKVIGRIWAGNCDPAHYRVSPINGPIDGLPPLYIFVGEHEICLPDARKFAGMLEAAGVDHEYYEYPMMNHVFPQYPIPEGADARRRMREILASMG